MKGIRLVPRFPRFLLLFTLLVALPVGVAIGCRISATAEIRPFSAGSYDAPPPQVSRKVKVRADLGWTDSRLTVRAGDQVRIEYLRGLWTYQDGVVAPHDADGGAVRYVAAGAVPAEQCSEPLPEANKGSLIARVGDSKPILIGNRGSFTAAQSGALELSINDSKDASGLLDNKGFILARVAIAKP